VCRLQEIDEALMSKMSPEEEEAVQAEFALLEREARGVVSFGSTLLEPAMIDRSYLVPEQPRPWTMSLKAKRSKIDYQQSLQRFLREITTRSSKNDSRSFRSKHRESKISW
jgi:hypothetical protein